MATISLSYILVFIIIVLKINQKTKIILCASLKVFDWIIDYVIWSVFKK